MYTAFIDLIKNHDKRHFMLLYEFMSEKVGLLLCLQTWQYKMHIVAMVPYFS